MARVRGLPTSWNSAARRSNRFGDVLSTTASVWASTSLCRWIGSCSRREAGQLGEEFVGQARAHDEPERHRGDIDHHDLVQLVADALGRDDGQPAVHALHRGRERRVGLEREAAEKRAARSMRSGSSPKEISGSSGVRSRPAARSPSPSKGSTSSMSGRREGERVDGEVATRQVDFEVVAEGHLGLARVGHVDLGPVGRDLVVLAALRAARWCRTAPPASTRRPPSPAPVARSPRAGRRS